MRVNLFKSLSFLILLLAGGCATRATFGDSPMTVTPGPLLLTQPASATSTALPIAIVTATPTPTATPNPYPWTDELFTMYGICFEAALDAAGQTFVLRDAAEHIRFYNLADNSNLCSRPVEREPFDFGDGERVLAGLWSVGRGCTAHHDVVDYTLADNALDLTVRFVTEGDCNYELVRPYWIGVPGVQDVQITVLNAGEAP